MQFFLALLFWLILGIFALLEFLMPIFEKLLFNICDFFYSLIDTLKEEKHNNDLLALKIYESGVDLYNNINDKENMNKIEILKKCVIPEILIN